MQGVFYRASAADQAQKLGLLGFVRNEHDGSVYAEVEGEEAQVRQFVEWARVGPARAVVEGCDVTEGGYKGFRSFEIQR